MRLQLANTEVELVSVRAELTQQQKLVSQLNALVDAVPKVEAEFGRLNRDYDVVRTKYGQLISQLERARIGEDVDEYIDDVTFRIVDPPFASSIPVGPRRRPFLAAVLMVAIALGGALAFLHNYLHPVFYSSRAVTLRSGVPILGVVSLLMSPAELRRKSRGNLYVVMAITLLLVSFVTVYLFAEQLSPLIRAYVSMTA
jgi:hypothetical protein